LFAFVCLPDCLAGWLPAVFGFPHILRFASFCCCCRFCANFPGVGVGGVWKAGADSRVGLVGANNRYYFVVFGNKSLQRFLPALLA